MPPFKPINFVINNQKQNYEEKRDRMSPLLLRPWLRIIAPTFLHQIKSSASYEVIRAGNNAFGSILISTLMY